MKFNLDKSMGYTCIPNSISRYESGLKPAETGILLHLLSHADSYRVSITNISRNMHTDIRTIKKLLNKLETKGYGEIILKVVKNYTINNDTPLKPIKLTKKPKLKSINPLVEISTTPSVNLHQKTVEISTTRINKESIIELIKENDNFIKLDLKEKDKNALTTNSIPHNNEITHINSLRVSGNAEDLPTTLTEEFLIAGKEINPYIDLFEKYLSFRTSKINKNHVNTDWLHAWTKYLENGIKLYGEAKQSVTNITNVGQKMDTTYKPLYELTPEEKQEKINELKIKHLSLRNEYIFKKAAFDKENIELFEAWINAKKNDDKNWVKLREIAHNHGTESGKWQDKLTSEINHIHRSLQQLSVFDVESMEDITMNLAQGQYDNMVNAN